MIQSAVVVPTSRDSAGALQKAVTRFAGSLFLSIAILGFAPQALCCRALRARVLLKNSKIEDLIPIPNQAINCNCTTLRGLHGRLYSFSKCVCFYIS